MLIRDNDEKRLRNLNQKCNYIYKNVLLHVSRKACKDWIFPKNISDTESVNRQSQSILRYYFIGSTCFFFGTYNYQRDFNVTNVASHGSYEVLL